MSTYSFTEIKYISFIYFNTISSPMEKIISFFISNIDEKNVSVKDQFNAESLLKIILCYSF